MAGREGRGGERRDFGPSQCWRQIDAPVVSCNYHRQWWRRRVNAYEVIYEV